MKDVTASEIRNESLTKTNHEFFRAVRERAKEKGWNFTWTWKGHIYARKDETTAPARFTYPDDVLKKIN